MKGKGGDEMTDTGGRSHRNLGPLRPVKGTSVKRKAGRRGFDPAAYRNFVTSGKVRPALSEPLVRKIMQVLRSGHVVKSQIACAENRPIGSSHLGLPAGYTYLLQLVGHDLVNSIFPSVPDDGIARPVTNQRHNPLRLDTLLGEGGTIGCPFAYDFDGPVATLRTGRPRKQMEDKTFTFADTPHELPRISFGPDGVKNLTHGLETVLIPDARNDDNLILGQLTALFNRIQGFIVRKLATIPNGPADDQITETAAMILIRIYRNIVRQDLLPRILHPKVHSLYDTVYPIFDEANENYGPSAEFAFVASRLGHALVRSHYNLNTGQALSLEDVINTSSGHHVGSVPIRVEYLIDWSLFFNTTKEIPEKFNWAMRFGPSLAPEMYSDLAAVAPTGDSRDAGTLFRDLMRENMAGLTPVVDLIDSVTRSGLNAWWPDSSTTTPEQFITKTILDGFDSLESKAYSSNLDEAEKKAVINNPPLSLFLMFESQMFGHDGATLGPLGSVIVAEAMWPAFKPFTWEREVMGDKIDDWTREVFGILPQTMPDLLCKYFEQCSG
jgi:hypothetical protein